MPVIYLMLEVYKIKAMTTDLSEFAGGGGGVLLYKSYNIGMCPKGMAFGLFSSEKGVYTLLILVWNWVWFCGRIYRFNSK